MDSVSLTSSNDHLDEEYDNKNTELIFDKSDAGKTIPVHSNNNDSPVDADTVTFDAHNHVDGNEEEDLDNEDVWSLSENVDG